jgi:hypothetical protein
MTCVILVVSTRERSPGVVGPPKPLSYALREGSFRLQLRVELLNGAGLLGLLNAPRQDGFKPKLATKVQGVVSQLLILASYVAGAEDNVLILLFKSTRRKLFRRPPHIMRHFLDGCRW